MGASYNRYLAFIPREAILGKFGRFWTIVGNLLRFRRRFRAHVYALKGGRQFLQPVWSILDNVGQFGTISTSILGKCQCFSGRATIDSESIDFEILLASNQIKSRKKMTLRGRVSL